ncbi:restriction endonuclease subunit S [uncultured Campylobacter sp.]|uniref:restriction endonuclease subunit S n=1 Tax=uncultured Campylobacter sp. TaxID=218934 RepID=UPI002608D937|nr:restriction endonuclease subunit S [uncultured Campylobacter sp.]
MSSQIYKNQIPNDWKKFNIGQDAFIKARIGWQSLRTQEYLDVGDYALVTGTDFNEGMINWNSCQYVSKWRYSQDIDIQLKEKDILVTKDGTIGKVGLVKNLPYPATLNSGIYVIRPKSADINPNFLFYMFMSKYFDDFINVISAGSTITHLYQKDFINFSFPLPPKAEQDRIAQVLSDMDELIGAKCELLDKKRTIKQAAAQQLLTPKPHWHTAALGEISLKMQSGGTPQATNEKFYGGDIYFLKISDITQSGKYIHKTQYTITKAGLENSSAWLVPIDSLIYSMYASVGFVSINKVELATSQAMMCIVINPEIIDLEFLYYALIKFKEKIYSLIETGTQGNLNSKIVKSIEISFPNLSEQTKIAQILSDMDDEISALQDEIGKLKMIKQGAMDELLSGKIRLKGELCKKIR